VLDGIGGQRHASAT